MPQQSALLAMVPYNMDFVFAMNVKRMRTHHQLKHLWTTNALLSSNIANITMKNLVNADEMVMVSTSVGTGNADTLTLIRGSNVLAIPNSVRIDKRTIAIGSKPMIAMIQQTINGERSSIINKRNNVINAMPLKALSFSVYAFGCFTFDARVSLARLLDLNSVPVCVSAWGDVVDDLAIIVHMTGKDTLEAVGLKKDFTAWIKKISKQAWVKRWGLLTGFQKVDVVQIGSYIRAVMLLNPKYFHFILNKIKADMNESSANGKI